MTKRIKLPFLKQLGLTTITNKDGDLIIRKIGVTAEQVKTSPAFAGTRKVSAEFGRAAKAGHLIRTAFAPWLLPIADNKHSLRLQQALFKMAQTDSFHPRGLRDPFFGEPEALQGFECNKKQRIHPSYWLRHSVSIMGMGDVCKITTKPVKRSIIESQDLFNATHIKITAVIVAFNLDSHDRQIIRPPEANPLPLDAPSLPGTLLKSAITLPGRILVLVGLAVQPFEYFNNQYIPIRNAAASSFRIIHVARLM